MILLMSFVFSSPNTTNIAALISSSEVQLATALALFVFFVSRVFWEAFQKHETIRAALQKLQPKKAAAIKGHENLLDVRVYRPESDLYFSIVQIEVHNKSSLAAHNVIVEFISITPKPRDFKGVLPVILPAVQGSGTTINPDATMRFSFFTVEARPQSRMITFFNGLSFEETLSEMLKKTSENELSQEYARDYPQKNLPIFHSAYSLSIRVFSADRPLVEKSIRLKLIPTEDDAYNLRPIITGVHISAEN